MKKDTPKVSVIMSCYNAEKYLNAAIDSILTQTFSDFEFIIWNDGSSDSTESIILSYSDKRIRYFYHENTGLGMAPHLACKEAKGEYIARMDADDISLPFRLQKEVDFLDRHKEYILVSSAVNYINEKGDILGISFPYTWDKIIRGVVYHFSVIVHPAVMFRRKEYNEVGGYVNVLGGEDKVLWGRMKEKGKFANIKEPLLNYRILSTSLSHFADGSPYIPLLKLLRYKIASDKNIKIADIELHNTIFNFIKANPPLENSSNNFANHSDTKNKLLICLTKIMGKEMAFSSILFCKNCIGFVKYLKLIYI